MLNVGVLVKRSTSWLNSNEKKDQLILKSTLFKEFESKIGKEGLMIEFGSVSCYSCQVMGRILYKIKQKYPKANIYFLDIYEDIPTAK